MSIQSLCPGCMAGKHTEHVRDWNIREGLIGGAWCGCTLAPADCERRFNDWAKQVMREMGISTPEASRHDIVRFYFSDADPVAECGCGWRGFGDAPVDAFRAWWAHSAERDRAPVPGVQENGAVT